MQLNTQAIVAFALFVGLAGVVVGHSGCPRPVDPNGTPVVRSDADFMLAQNQAASLSMETIKKMELDQPVPESAMPDLKKSAKLFDAMIAYQPTNFTLYYGAGQIAFALNDMDKAQQYFLQASSMVPDAPNADMIQLGAMSDYYLARIYFFKKEYDKAEASIRNALGRVPQHPDFLWQFASILAQQGKKEEALKYLGEALQFEPGHAKSLALKKLIEGK